MCHGVLPTNAGAACTAEESNIAAPLPGRNSAGVSRFPATRPSTNTARATNGKRMWRSRRIHGNANKGMLRRRTKIKQPQLDYFLANASKGSCERAGSPQILEGPPVEIAHDRVVVASGEGASCHQK